MFTIYNIVAYQVAWFACVLGAAYGMPWKRVIGDVQMLLVKPCNRRAPIASD